MEYLRKFREKNGHRQSFCQRFASTATKILNKDEGVSVFILIFA
mgnify:FL=1